MNSLQNSTSRDRAIDDALAVDVEVRRNDDLGWTTHEAVVSRAPEVRVVRYDIDREDGTVERTPWTVSVPQHTIDDEFAPDFDSPSASRAFARNFASALDYAAEVADRLETGEAIARTAAGAGVEVAELAERTGLDESYVRDVLALRQPLHVEPLVAIAAALDIPAAQLLPMHVSAAQPPTDAPAPRGEARDTVNTMLAALTSVEMWTAAGASAATVVRELASELFRVADEIDGPPARGMAGAAGSAQHLATQRIRQLIASTPLRQNELAVAAGYGPAEFSDLLTGRCRMDLEDLARIARALAVEPFDLLTGGDR